MFNSLIADAGIRMTQGSEFIRHFLTGLILERIGIYRIEYYSQRPGQVRNSLVVFRNIPWNMQ